jgi:hypothetical protein
MALLTVTVAGPTLARLQAPTLPALDGLRVIGTSTQQSVSLINGRMQSTYGFVYQLQPTRKGTLSIPSIGISVRGKTYQTAPLTLQVSSGSGQAGGQSGGAVPGYPGGAAPTDPFAPGPMGALSPQDAVAVRHKVDRNTVYVGQQVTYMFTFYQAEQLAGDVSYREAEMPGFVAEPLPNPPATDETLNGRLYRTQKRPKALFATAPGKHTIGRAMVTVTLDPFMGTQELVADPVTVNVLPLPQANQPPSFTGAVGKFRVVLSADQTAVRAGETINVQAQVTGSGNIKSLGAPKLNLPASVRLYEAGDSRKAEAGGGGDPDLIGGTAVFSYLVLPRQSGTLTLGPVAFPYFDPVARSYRTAASNAIAIQVTAGVVSAADSPAPGAGLRPIRSTPGRLVGTPLPFQWWFWAALGIPLLALAWAGWRRWQVAAALADPQLARAARALRLARGRFADALRCLDGGDCDACYAQLHAAVCDYVADRLGAPPAGLTADTVYQRLLAAGCTPDLAEQARLLLERAAGGRFAPGGGDPQQARATVRECEGLVMALQKEVRPARGDE